MEMLSKTVNHVQWNQFIALEEDFVASLRYVELCESNLKTYSTEYAKLLLAAGSEIDVGLKQIYSLLTHKSSENKGICACKTALLDYERKAGEDVIRLSDIAVGIKNNEVLIFPWDAWRGEAKENPIWWDNYNDVKHQRAERFDLANLENVLFAFAGLEAILVTYYRLAGAITIIPAAKHFRLPPAVAAPADFPGGVSGFRVDENHIREYVQGGQAMFELLLGGMSGPMPDFSVQRVLIPDRGFVKYDDCRNEGEQAGEGISG
ncbi:hypothetical protein EGYY_07840 [Eggerthella sp. YY7918]|nr:hypothetical protein EGYY_07840 [Eggerthella sp. YY7918]